MAYGSEIRVKYLQAKQACKERSAHCRTIGTRGDLSHLAMTFSSRFAPSILWVRYQLQAYTMLIRVAGAAVHGPRVTIGISCPI